MAKGKAKADATPCQWINGPQAFKEFATHKGKTQSARHIKPLHWYIACRLVIEGGFRPEDITPRPPFWVEEKKVLKGGRATSFTTMQAKADPASRLFLVD